MTLYLFCSGTKGENGEDMMNDVVLISMNFHLSVKVWWTYMKSPGTEKYVMLLMVLLQDLRGFQSSSAINLRPLENVHSGWVDTDI
jgi:hypothetical protein